MTRKTQNRDAVDRSDWIIAESCSEILSHGLAMQSLMMISGLGILCWLVIRSRANGRRKVKSAVITKHLKHNSNASSQPEPFSGTQSLGAPTDVLKWQIELHDLGRDLKAELDSKMLAVRAIMRQYEHAANRLSDLIRLSEELPAECVEHRIRLASEKLRQAGWNDSEVADLFAISHDSDTRAATGLRTATGLRDVSLASDSSA